VLLGRAGGLPYTAWNSVPTDWKRFMQTLNHKTRVNPSAVKQSAFQKWLLKKDAVNIQFEDSMFPRILRRQADMSEGKIIISR